MIIEAFNAAVTNVASAVPLGADYVSPIIDFRDSSHGSLQIRWAGVAAFMGIFVIHGSNWRDLSTFDDNDIEQSDYTIAKAAGSHLWSYHHLTFRYAQLRWAANGNSAGLADIVARGCRA